MQLKDLLAPDAVNLRLTGAQRDRVLTELVGLLGLDQRASAAVLRVLQRREGLGSTGIGRGIAIPHGRSLAVSRLRLAYGRHHRGIDYQAIDGKPVHSFFLIV